MPLGIPELERMEERWEGEGVGDRTFMVERGDEEWNPEGALETHDDKLRKCKTCIILFDIDQIVCDVLSVCEYMR